MNVGIIGIGGVGGYFGGKLTGLLGQVTNKDLKIYFVARNKHLEEIKKNGLLLSTVEGETICRPTLATDNIGKLPELDLCLICVKIYDLNSVLKAVKNKIKDDTDIIPLLNGVDIYERVRKIIPNGVVYPSCAYVGTHLERCGKVTQNGGSCTILFGSDLKHPEVIPQRVFEIFEAASVKYKWCKDPYVEIWRKYIFVSSYAMITASEDKTLGQILESEELSEKLIGIMKEIEAIAQKQDVNFPDNIVETSFNQGKNFPYETKTSFQRDFEQKDKSDERELYGNTIIRLGESLGVATPITRSINEKLNLNKK